MHVWPLLGVTGPAQSLRLRMTVFTLAAARVGGLPVRLCLASKAFMPSSTRYGSTLARTIAENRCSTRHQSLKRCRSPVPLAVWGGLRRSMAVPDRAFAADAATPKPQGLGDLIVTPSCIRRIKALKAKSGKAELRLRLSVEGGGCSGFQYTFTMDDGPVNEDDKVFESNGAQVIVDEGSLEFVRGATIDYVDEMMRSAFAVLNNPMSESACGCGSSFALKSFEKNPALD